jgi:Ca2+-binding RTX toxin-like protein
MAIIRGTDRGETRNGTEQADQIFGLGGDDVLIGRGGDDLLEGGAGTDELFGTNGFDTASYQSSPTGVEVSLRDFAAEYGHAGGDELTNIEGLRGSAFADTFQGNDSKAKLATTISSAMMGRTSSAAVAATTACRARPAMTS